jgi:hypothetical protein
LNKKVELSAAGKPVVVVPKHILNFDDCLDVNFTLKKEVKSDGQKRKKS